MPENRLPPSPVSAAHQASDRHGLNWDDQSIMQYFDEFVEDEELCEAFVDFINDKAESEAEMELEDGE
jgi:hypothetical protein